LANCLKQGTDKAVLDGVRTEVRARFAVVVPAGTNHDIINTGTAPMKLYTHYAPPNHRYGVVQHTRAYAETVREHFDGKTTEWRLGDQAVGEIAGSGFALVSDQTPACH